MITSIAIDATHFKSELPTGVEQYVYELLPRLSSRLLAANVAVTWIGHTEQAPIGMPEKVAWLYSKSKPYWSQVSLPAVLTALKPSLYFTPSGIPPIFYSGKTAVTVHDLAVYLVPEAYSRSDRFRLKALSKRAVRQASSIITPSHYSEEMLVRLWTIPSSRIAVIPLGLSEQSTSLESLEGVTADPLFVYVGRIELKKNLLPLLEGFQKLAQESACQLVLAGKDGIGSGQLHKIIAGFPPTIRSRILMPGYISNAQKQWLFSRATAILIPSEVEGFGLPLLEAFEAKVPAICARGGALLEVGRDAALFAEADIGADWYLQMTKTLHRDDIKHMIERGSSYVKEYTWDSAAQKTAATFLAL
jgi:glycosyltransferase involved in cell wall biosynthesis